MSEQKAQMAAVDQAGASDPEGDTNLGKFLAAARERRGMSREEVINETRIPAHYLRMLESNDYSMISDQLYLLPFLRKYAVFLQLDPEETAMRFVREVQRADSNPSPARLAEPLDNIHRRKNRNWTGIAVVVALIAIIVGAYVAESRHRESNDNSAMETTPAASAEAISPVQAIKPEASAPAVAARGASPDAMPPAPPIPAIQNGYHPAPAPKHPMP